MNCFTLRKNISANLPANTPAQFSVTVNDKVLKRVSVVQGGLTTTRPGAGWRVRSLGVPVFPNGGDGITAGEAGFLPFLADGLELTTEINKRIPGPPYVIEVEVYNSGVDPAIVDVILFTAGKDE